MAKFFTLITAAAALASSVLAAEPLPEAARGHLHCGHALINKYEAYTETELATFTPQDFNRLQTLYPIDSNGAAVFPNTWCHGGTTCVDNADDQDAFCA